MLRYRICMVIMAIAIAIMIVASALFVAFFEYDVQEKSYSSQITKMSEEERAEQGLEMTDFDAWLQYSIIVDGFAGDDDKAFMQGEVTLCQENLDKLTKLREFERNLEVVLLFSVILLIAGYLGVYKRRMFSGVVWGGIAGVILGAIPCGLVAISKSGIFYQARRMIFYDDYSGFFSDKDLLIKLIPESMALRMFLFYGGVIVIGFVITIIVRYVTYRKSQPHRFN